MNRVPMVSDFFFLATEELKDAARAIIDKLSIKNGAYPPDSYPNPGKLIRSFRPRLVLNCLAALGFHNAQLQAAAFREEFDPEAFEDLTLPKIDMIHKARNMTLTCPRADAFYIIACRKAHLGVERGPTCGRPRGPGCCQGCGSWYETQSDSMFSRVILGRYLLAS
jgi:hypothetical protein